MQSNVRGVDAKASTAIARTQRSGFVRRQRSTLRFAFRKTSHGLRRTVRFTHISLKMIKPFPLTDVILGQLRYVDETGKIIATHGESDNEADYAELATAEEPESQSDASDTENAWEKGSPPTSDTGEALSERLLLHNTFITDTGQSDQDQPAISSNWLSPNVSRSPFTIYTSNVGTDQTHLQWMSHVTEPDDSAGKLLDIHLNEDNAPASRNVGNQAASARDRAIFLRYFMQELSPWFDLCDPYRHFGQVVPQRARTSETLLNAICTAAARHLVRLQEHKKADDALEWNGLLLPHVEQDSVWEYQNECIRDLLRFSIDPEQIQNVDLLAASIILRTDEEIDTPYHEGKTPKDVFLRVTGAFMEAQTPLVAAIPHSSPQIYSIKPATNSAGVLTTGEVAEERSDLRPKSPLSPTTRELLTTAHGSQADGLRQACFWIALRQELHASFMTQQAFTFPLSKFDSFRDFSPAIDAVWADRVVIFHADVLEFCYTILPNLGVDRQRWLNLKEQADFLQSSLPASFIPIHEQEGCLGPTRLFPEILYLDTYHVTAAAYAELTRILLVTFDPGRKKLGSGYLASQREVMAISKTACVKLCGMALSNKQAPPIHLNACAAVMLCGEYFDNKVEQEALVWFLKMLEENLAYPTANLVAKLIKAWNW
ncbi:uncharacterized protein PV07_09489 [Cladophialophora immunda]|uniref:ARCA protein n=1 Tax=Cladophialophora immunda TaxID=569365 RepID=A0A0D2C7B2_9EURO|nr:uncharacterized protein PV07_09489 [Cladophialophora immunda]KIW26390.1 hypothetical protein PV07_09489 [Cladophialophora immunda]